MRLGQAALNLPKPLTQLPADADRRDAGKQSGSKVTRRLFKRFDAAGFQVSGVRR
ncbi:MAG: hypothetical protein GY758_10860 [Fuerstiella sp.]|nr:hypothetical protein [Fuerstiella sp.]MCP4786579.1 hypothetical protein [Fuerstiella sp.]